jgi:hypothetical protein
MATIQETSTPRRSPSDAIRPRVSVVIPCLNEADSIEQSVTATMSALGNSGLAGEVLVVDNGSEDGSGELAERAGARVIREPRRGYGSAYLAGFDEARGEYIVMLDADLTYPADEIPRFIEQLENGAELVMGDRMDNIQPGAMPWLHRYVGNPILSGILNLFFRTGVRDAHCGMRAFRRDVLPKLDLRTTGMEFASEMVIRAAKEHLDIRQIPIEYRPRAGESKLSSFRDGWRHLRFLLVHQPTYLFLVPGAFMSLVGAIIVVMVAAQLHVLGRAWDIHTMIAGALLLIVGSQVLALGLAARAYGVYFMDERDPLFDYLSARVRLEHGLLAGGALIVLGLALGAVIVYRWAERGFGELSEARLAVMAAAVMIVGIQVFFSSFLLSILGLRRRS